MSSDDQVWSAGTLVPEQAQPHVLPGNMDRKNRSQNSWQAAALNFVVTFSALVTRLLELQGKAV